jgi:hypothetical protein
MRAFLLFSAIDELKWKIYDLIIYMFNSLSLCFVYLGKTTPLGKLKTENSMVKRKKRQKNKQLSTNHYTEN